jgi:hypothetical protein
MEGMATEVMDTGMEAMVTTDTGMEAMVTTDMGMAATVTGIMATGIMDMATITTGMRIGVGTTTTTDTVIGGAGTGTATGLEPAGRGPRTVTDGFATRRNAHIFANGLKDELLGPFCSKHFRLRQE